MYILQYIVRVYSTWEMFLMEIQSFIQVKVYLHFYTLDDGIFWFFCMLLFVKCYDLVLSFFLLHVLGKSSHSHLAIIILFFTFLFISHVIKLLAGVVCVLTLDSLKSVPIFPVALKVCSGGGCFLKQCFVLVTLSPWRGRRQSQSASSSTMLEADPTGLCHCHEAKLSRWFKSEVGMDNYNGSAVRQ